MAHPGARQVSLGLNVFYDRAPDDGTPKGTVAWNVSGRVPGAGVRPPPARTCVRSAACPPTSAEGNPPAAGPPPRLGWPSDPSPRSAAQPIGNSANGSRAELRLRARGALGDLEHRQPPINLRCGHVTCDLAPTNRHRKVSHQKLFGIPNTCVPKWLRIRLVEMGATW
jgi:hypothetical protein